MSLKEPIETEYKKALKSKDKTKISTYRLIISSIKDLDILNRSGQRFDFDYFDKLKNLDSNITGQDALLKEISAKPDTYELRNSIIHKKLLYYYGDFAISTSSLYSEILSKAFGIHKKSILPLGGILSGFFGGLTGNQGALRSAFLIKMDLDKTVFIATTVVISFFVDLTRIGVYISNIKDFEISNYVVLGLAATLSAIIGSYIGFKSLKKITLNYIRNLVAVMILLIAFLLLLGVL